MQRSTFVLIATLALFAACTQVAEQHADQREGAAAMPRYPIDPRVHLSGNYPSDVGPSDVKAKVSNAVAYARRALRLVGEEPPAAAEGLELALVEGWARAAARSGVSPAAAFSFASAQATPEEQAALAQALQEGALVPDEDPRLSKVQLRYADLQKGVDNCQSQGVDPARCCAAVGYFAALMRPDDMAAAANSLDDAAFYARHAAALQKRENEAVHSGDKLKPQPFVHLGLRAWLSVCEAPLQNLPKTLSELVQRFGDFRQDGRWEQELHPLSLAKQAGRRIYRRRLADGTLLSVAESLADDCTVRETEVILAVPHRPLAFASYDHHEALVPFGYFPAGRGDEVVKLTPESCMGCHYTFDERRFNVVAPSFAALGLRLFMNDGEPTFRDDIACRQDGEAVVYHDAPVIH